MNRIMMTGAVLSCLFFFSGCATIMSHGPQTLHIISQPDGAICEITDTTEGKSIANATTPYTVSLERGAGYFLKKYYDVTLSKDGYMKEKITLTPQLNFWYVCNIFLGGALGALIVDPLTGSIWTFYEKDVSVKPLCANVSPSVPMFRSVNRKLTICDNLKLTTPEQV